MRFGPTNPRSTVGRGRKLTRSQRGFTLTETLAALLFLAIVIPVAVRGIQLATYAAVVSQRRQVATRVAQDLLAEAFAPTTGSTLGRSGSVLDDAIPYRWELLSEPWTDSTMRLVSAEVFFDVQGREHDVRLSTLGNPNGL